MDDQTLFRFGGIQRLYGSDSFAKIHQASALLIGLGGVGSWTAEALARSGIGQITLVDFDDICVSNTNRQIHATVDQIGKLKTESLAKRLLLINPQIKIDCIDEAFCKERVDQIFQKNYHVVIDAIDDSQAKFELIVECHERNLPLVVSGAAGGRINPGMIQMADLSQSREDKMLSSLRKRLRQKAGFPRQGKMNLPCVFSSEKAFYPTADGCTTREKPNQFKTPLDCATGFGTATHITGTFGFCLAYMALQAIVKK